MGPAQPPPFALGAAGPPTFGEGPALGAGLQHPPHNPRPSSKHCLVPASACRLAALGLFLIKQALPGGQCGVLAFTSHVTLGSEGSQGKKKKRGAGRWNAGALAPPMGAIICLLLVAWGREARSLTTDLPVILTCRCSSVGPCKVGVGR